VSEAVADEVSSIEASEDTRTKLEERPRTIALVLALESITADRRFENQNQADRTLVGSTVRRALP
jgi:hypothetical protein